MSSPVQSVYNWYRSIIRNPKYRWWVIIGTAVYLISPFDFLPDFIPFLGQLDDAVILSLLVAEVAQVLGDRLKATKSSQTPTPTSSDSTGQAPTEASTVDINAVPID